MNKNTKFTTAAIFSDDEIISHRYAIFQHTNLGRFYHSIPYLELSELLPSKGIVSAGATPWFDNAGMLAVIFLKSFLGFNQ